MHYRKTYIFKDADFMGEFAEPLKKCRDWLLDWENKHTNLVICGTTGTGKTYFAMSFLNHLAQTADFYPDYTLPSGHKCSAWWDLDGIEYITEKELFDAMKQQLAKDTDTAGSAKELLQNIKIAKLLLVDEVGTGASTDYEKSELSELLDYRWKNGLPCVFLANLKLRGLANYWSDRTRQRALDGASYVELENMTLRKKPKAL